MSRTDMETALAVVPRVASDLAHLHPQLIQVSDALNEAIYGVLIAAAREGVERVALIITPSRVIEVTPGGAVERWRYMDMTRLILIEGRKKLIGRDPEFLRVEFPGGGSLNWLLPSAYHEHSVRVGQMAEEASRRQRPL